MALIQIRDVDDSDLAVLKLRAAAAGQSLNAYMGALVRREARSPTVAEVLDRAAARAGGAGVSAAAAVTEARAEREAQLGEREVRVAPARSSGRP